MDESTLLTFAATATDTNWPPQVWTFSLAGDIPAGAAITTNGVFTWTPSEAQGPGAYPITVVVTDDGDPAAVRFQHFPVTVNEVNTAPTMPPITNRTVVAGTPITFTVTGSDADLPAQTLTSTLWCPEPGRRDHHAGRFLFLDALRQPGAQHQCHPDQSDR